MPFGYSRGSISAFATRMVVKVTTPPILLGNLCVVVVADDKFSGGYLLHNSSLI